MSIAMFVAAPALAMAAPADARPSTAIVVVASARTQPSDAPVANLAGKGARAKFKPPRLKGHLYANDGECEGGGVSVTIANATGRAYTITVDGNPFRTMIAHTTLPFCVYGDSPTTVLFGIVGSSHTLSLALNAKY